MEILIREYGTAIVAIIVGVTLLFLLTKGVNGYEKVAQGVIYQLSGADTSLRSNYTKSGSRTAEGYYIYEIR